ncbi:MAG: DUF5652 family protein [Candidatus Margulisbacteria bacterium]|jgi:methionyl-tRNA synthetase|nr:DUF5652 family protein [Candidatus Margulisiibacteriota bacterium]
MENLPLNLQLLIILVLAWSLYWKGKALWQAARHEQRGWFIAILIINTVGLLELTYLWFFQKPKA